jgi:hypothetical protein
METPPAVWPGLLDALRWCVDRSDHLRASYAVRAYNVITADAVLAGVAIFGGGRLVDSANSVLRTSIGYLLAIGLLGLALSIVFAVLGSTRVGKSSGIVAGYAEGKRVLVNSEDTFKTFSDVRGI